MPQVFDEAMQDVIPFKVVLASDAYQYMITESVWGWRKYADDLYFETVSVDAVQELARAAKADLVRTAGRSWSGDRVVYPDKWYWRKSYIWGNSNVNGPGYSVYHLSVSDADMRKVWPKASIARRLWTMLVVRAKKAAIMRGLWVPTRPKHHVA